MSHLRTVPVKAVYLALLLAVPGCPTTPGGQGVAPPEPLEEIPRHHNQYVGNWDAEGTLPDGRTLHYELAASPLSVFTGRFAVGAAWADVGALDFDLDRGTLALGEGYGAMVDGLLIESSGGRGVPGGEGDSQLSVREAAGHPELFDVHWSRRTIPLGDDNNDKTNSKYFISCRFSICHQHP